MSSSELISGTTLHGLQFTAARYQVGGWASVNRAHRQPPRTTEQVLHPEKFAAGEPGETVEVRDVPELEAAGFERVAVDTLGELELGV